MARSPLARLLLALNDSGVSFREMERIALARAIRYTSSSFEQVAKDERRGRLDINAIHAIAAVTGKSATEIAALDDERWGLRHHGPPQLTDGDVENYIRRALDPDAGEHIITQFRLLRELAQHRKAVTDPTAGRSKTGDPAARPQVPSPIPE